MKSKLLMLSFLLVVLAMGCSRSVEGETKAWTRNQQTVKDLMTLYPRMGGALNEQLNKATSAWDAAQSVSGDDAKIEAMANANRLLNSGFVQDLSRFEKEEKDLQALIIDVQTNAKGSDDARSAFVVRDQANATLRQARMSIDNGAISAAQATVVMDKVTKDMAAATKNLKKVNDGFKKKETSAQKEKAADKAAEKAETAPWTCSYCSKSNPADATECGGCGAGHEKK